MSIDIRWELDVLAQCVRDPSYIRQAIPVLKRHDFSTRPNSWIWSVVHDTYSECKELPSARLWTNRLVRDFDDDADRDYHIALIMELKRRKVAAPRTALAEIRRFVRVSNLKRAAAAIVENVDKGDVDEAERDAGKALGEARASAGMRETRRWAAEAETRLKAYTTPDTMVRYRTPLKTLNDHLGGGLRPGTIGIAIAQTNVGKSAWGVTLGYEALCRGAVVAHVVTEETEDECLARYDARFTLIPRDKLTAGDLTDEEREAFLDRFKRHGAGRDRLFIREIAPSSSVAMVRVFAEEIREQFRGQPMLLVVDSPDHLQSIQKAESFRLSASAVAMTLKAMSLDEGLSPLAVWSTAQAPQAAGNKIRANTVSESYDKTRVADVALGLVEGEGSADGDTKLVDVLLVKNRLGKFKNWRYHCTADMAICEFTEDSNSSFPKDGKAKDGEEGDDE